MPRLQDIERFKRDLAALSNEAETLAAWGETPEDIRPPEGAVSAPPEAAAKGRAEAKPAAEEGLPPDFASLLDELPLEKGEAATDAELEALLAPAAPEEGGEAPPEEAAAPFEAAAPEEFSIPGLDEAFLMPEGAAESAANAPAEGELPPLDFTLAKPRRRPPPRNPPRARPSHRARPSRQARSFPISERASSCPRSRPAKRLRRQRRKRSPRTRASRCPKQVVPSPRRKRRRAAPPREPRKRSRYPSSRASDPRSPPPRPPRANPSSSPASESFEVPAAEPFELPAAEGFEAPPGEESFSIPELGELGEAPESAAAEEAGAPTEAAAPADEFSIPDFGLEEAEAAGGAAEELGAGGFGEAPQAAEEGFSFGEGLDLGPAEESSGAAAGAAPAADSFESFSFEEPGAAGGMGLGAGLGNDLDSELASLGEATPAADTFSIDREWGGFGEGGGEAAPPRQAPTRPSARPAAAEKYKAVNLTEPQVDRLQDSLLSFPLNLRVAIEDIVANEKGSMAQRSKLIWAMVDGASAEDVALLASRVIKRRIEIPKGFEKRTGAAFEAEKGSLGYILVHTVLPVLRVVLLAAAMAGALGWLGYRFIYTALAANAEYRAGYQRIAESRYPEAERSFAKASAMKDYVAWYYRYAEAYVAKRQYLLAERKYASLVDRYPKETRAILEWAKLEKDQLKFEEAVKVLKGTDRKPGEETRGMSGLLSWDYFNKDGLLLLGDIYLDWAEEDPKRYEDARIEYARLIERYGQLDLYMGRMLLYFIRTDNLKEIKPLVARYVTGRTVADAATIPLDAQTLAELGGYLLDKGMIEDVRSALTVAAIKDPALPEAHYHIARYFRQAGDQGEERKALDNAIKTFELLPGLGAKREGMYIDSLIWRGRFRLAGGEWMSAEQDYSTAAAEYERGVGLKRLKRSPRFGEAYAGLAEVAYWQREDLGAALGLYERAAADGYDTPDTRYKRAYILYRQDRTADSLIQFYRAGMDGQASPYLDYAFGDALFARGDYFAAEGYFRRVVEAMARELAEIDMPSPQERPSQGEIVELLMKAQNNLGASIYKVSSRIGDPRRRSAAMAAFSESTRLFDSLTRDQATLVRTESKNLGFLNMDFILHPQRGMDVTVYTEIQREMRFPKRK